MQEVSAGWRLTSGDPDATPEEVRRDFSAGFIRRRLVDEYALVIHTVIQARP